MNTRAIGLVGIIAVSGCEKVDLFEHDYTTPEGVRIVENGYEPNVDLIDQKYLDTLECLQEFGNMPNTCYQELLNTGSLSPECQEQVEEIPDYKWNSLFVTHIKSEAGEPFDCISSPSGRCAGEYDPNNNRISIDEDAGAFAHELVHHFAGDYSHTGPTRFCGDAIDSFYNNQEMSEQQKELLLHDVARFGY